MSAGKRADGLADVRRDRPELGLRHGYVFSAP
jgi:hypothetical protein